MRTHARRLTPAPRSVSYVVRENGRCTISHALARSRRSSSSRRSISMASSTATEICGAARCSRPMPNSTCASFVPNPSRPHMQVIDITSDTTATGIWAVEDRLYRTTEFPLHDGSTYVHGFGITAKLSSGSTPGGGFARRSSRDCTSRCASCSEPARRAPSRSAGSLTAWHALPRHGGVPHPKSLRAHTKRRVGRNRSPRLGHNRANSACPTAAILRHLEANREHRSAPQETYDSQAIAPDDTQAGPSIPWPAPV